ncbi:hypothetical protein A1O3_08252 [Capronia epimyces CBS 606.96]|uniref:L-serine ammonia-lyase n=1 Tax=Capronia epimyces CBS 606.96 TaxID=1182542 RepID=W9XSM1_9EURO|nr:uncharacterized protein A1O3_08252 [Capronia epimyces CBS 606.96]EXJ79966.1 hypothetical protein A1O3_08252 [Capronia epimyces CBS 606.96]
MKLENLQPSGSFKSRGVGNLVRNCVQRRRTSATASHGPKIHFISSSGGNAGLAATTAARQLDQDVTVVVPKTTGRAMRDKLVAAGARVLVHGATVSDADEYVKHMVADDPKSVYVPPFDHEDIWQGNSTIIDELHAQLDGHPPTAIICSVGGGGLFNGIMQGLERHGWTSHVQVLAVETSGADSLAQSLQAGELITLPCITSIARSLGVTRVSERTLAYADARPDLVHSLVLSDAAAAMACVRFADQEKIMVEAACGAAVAACDQAVLRAAVHGFGTDSTIVVVVCGGKSKSCPMPYFSWLRVNEQAALAIDLDLH